MMRRLSPLPLAVALLLIAAPEGLADGTFRGGTMHHHHVSGPHRFFAFPFASRFGTQLGLGSNTFAPFAPLFADDGYVAPVAAEPAPTAVPPGILALNAPPAPHRPAADERPTVEITPSGVQIVRGPGTRHTGW